MDRSVQCNFNCSPLLATLELEFPGLAYSTSPLVWAYLRTTHNYPLHKPEFLNIRQIRKFSSRICCPFICQKQSIVLHHKYFPFRFFDSFLKPEQIKLVRHCSLISNIAIGMVIKKYITNKERSCSNRTSLVTILKVQNNVNSIGLNSSNTDTYFFWPFPLFRVSLPFNPLDWGLTWWEELSLTHMRGL